MKNHFRIVFLLLVLFIGGQQLKAQSKTVTGTVVTDQGETLIGVTVTETGTTNGVIAGLDGDFSITVKKVPSSLTFNYVGFVTKTVDVTEQTKNLRIVMVEDSKQLDEVIVMGYGTQKKANVIGAVSSIKTEELSKMSVSGIGNLIQGRAAGVQVTNGNVTIRGVGSINGMSPLYVIDGVPSIGNTDNLRDIEDIQIIRDASAAAIYGSRAAGGVILITTKRGTKKEKANINFSMEMGFSKATFMPELLGTADYKKAWAEIIPSATGWDESVDTDWVDYLYGTGKEQKYNVSVDGGGENCNYYVSLRYNRYDDKNDVWSEGYSLRMNSDYKLRKNLKIGESLTLYTSQNNPSALGGSNANSYALPYRSSPMMKAYNEDGSYGGLPASGNYNGGNWSQVVSSTDNRNRSISAQGNMYIDYEPIQGLHIRATGAGSWNASSKRQSEAKWYVSGMSYQDQDNLRKQMRLATTYMGNMVMSYEKTIKAHDFKILLGGEATRSAADDLSGSIYAVTSSYTMSKITDAFPVSNPESSVLSNVPSNTNGRSTDMSYGISRMLGTFARVNYSYADKYLFEFNVRQDQSDRFAKSNRKGTFPSLALGWRMIEEDFIKNNVPHLSNLKLRVTYGSLGNDGIGSYAYIPSLANYSKTQFNELSGTGAVNGWGIGNGVNQAIKWETVVTKNIGVDVGLFNNRLNMTLDYYIRNTKDMLYTRYSPWSTGMMYGHMDRSDTYPVAMNLGEMRNNGLEFTLSYSDKFGAVGFDFGFNAAFNHNKILYLDGGQNLPIDKGTAGEYWSGTVARTQVDSPISQFYGLKTNGLIPDQKTIDELNALAQSKGHAYYYASGTGPGDIWYVDLNGDGVVNDEDKTFIGNPLPKMTFGFNLGLSYKGFDVSAFFNGTYGNDVYNGLMGYYRSVYNDFNTTADVFNSSYMYGNKLTSQPRWGYNDGTSFIYDPNGNYKRISDYHVQDGSFLRLQNLQIGYTVPKKILNKIGISRMRIYYSGQNLFVLSKVKYADPEVGYQGANSTALTQGIMSASVGPKARQHTFGFEFGL